MKQPPPLILLAPAWCIIYATAIGGSCTKPCRIVHGSLSLDPAKSWHDPTRDCRQFVTKSLIRPPSNLYYISLVQHPSCQQGYKEQHSIIASWFWGKQWKIFLFGSWIFPVWKKPISSVHILHKIFCYPHSSHNIFWFPDNIYFFI